ncbi:mechanosensitive ion channel family protein [Mesorhizobium sp. ZC-5]|uniref:mechanosensitive ion channel family protein n=1 Tax=Mesorhizobium sp. ZC-5 TaxID=2986066 RepID=UPI0021E74DF7|nr:mechanosensitive ion channel family protein [Mesorhizobium sp. ZC-5]MCV3240936.1 mechanosensitive ion channel family protein [Mesorhizobium sp. ZC-5]
MSRADIMFPAVFRRFAVLLILLVATAMPSGAMAQSVGDGIVAEQQKIIEGLTGKVDSLEKEIAANAEDDVGLVEIRLQLEEIGRELLTSGQAFRPRLAEINARLEQFGPAPAEGQPPEPDMVTRERQSLAAEKAEINGLLGIAENLSIRINSLVNKIADMRRELFANLLTKRTEINYDLGGEVAEAFGEATDDLYHRTASWLRFVVQFKLNSMLAATFFGLIAAAVLLIGGRRLFGRVFEADPANENPSYLSRLSVAFWSTLMPTAAVSVFLATIYLLYDYFAVLRLDIAEIMTALFIVIGIVFFVHRLAKAVLSPRLPNWRLIAVETRAARPLLWLVSATAFFTGVDVFLSTVYRVLGSPLSLTVGESLVATVLTGIPMILIGLIRPFVDENGKPKRWHPLLRFTFYFLGGLTIVSALLGYIGFARFLSAQIVLTGAVLATMYIGFLSARAIADEGAFAHTALGRRLARGFNLDDPTLDQLGLVVSVAINLFVVVIGLPLILFLWGFQPGDITAWAYKLATEIRIGSVSFSLIGLLTGLIVFVFGYFLTRWFQGWLDGSVMARGRVDLGVRNSIRTVVGYAGLALAALVGVSAAGIDLSNLALIAGGLSLGIGFGLQNVVSNFVSGLILLAERPFKAGDWIVAGTVSGTVKKISVRATEIETFQRQTVILPNSELINAAVGNWTHKNKLGRIDIKINVAYGSDPKRAHAILLEIARSHPLVLKNPEPFVLFANFGLAALEFEIRVFLADILNGNVVQNDIRFAVLEAFAEAHVDMPSTPRAAVELLPSTEVEEPGAEEAQAESSEPGEPGPEKPAPKPKRKSKVPDPD